MTKRNKTESKSSSPAASGAREFSLAGVLVILAIALGAGFTLSIVCHVAVAAMSGAWHWGRETKAGIDIASGDKKDKESLAIFKNIDLPYLDDSLYLLSATQGMLRMDYASALADVEKISKTYRESDPGCTTMEIECRLSLKQSEPVKELSSAAIAKNPRDYTGWLWRGQANEQLKLYDKAIADYKQALQVFPFSSGSLAMQMPSSFSDKIEKAICGMIRRRMGACFERLGNFKEASNEYLKAVEISEPGIATERAKFDAETKSEALRKVDELNRVIASRPNDPHLHLMRCRALRKLGKLEDALADLNHVKGKGSPSEYLERAAVNYALADYKSAARDLRKANPEDPLYEVAHMRQRKYMFAVAPITSMKKSRILNSLDRVIQANPAESDNYLSRGVLQLSFRQYEEGARDIELYLSGKSGVKTISVAKANIFLAICRGLQKRKTEYEILLTKTAETFSDYKWWQAVANCLAEKGVSDKTLLDSAKDDKARLVQAHYYVGQRLAIAGFRAKAEEQFRAGVAVGAINDEYYLCKLALLPDPGDVDDDK